MIARAAFAILMMAGAALANAPDQSLRPVLRTDAFPPALPSFAPDRSVRPRLRPAAPRGVAAVAVAQPTVRSRLAPSRSLRPNLRPRWLETQARRKREAAAGATAAAVVKTTPKKATTTKVGSVCRDRKLIGTEVGKVPGKLAGCGIKSGAIKLHSVSGVALSTPAVMECGTAQALRKYVEGGMKKSVGRYGGGVVRLKVAAGYSCRTRNSRKGAKISEHGKGRAIDLSGFILKNGDTLSVLNDWGQGKKGRILKAMHKTACGPFGTVLGPNSDRYHKDHFHFDVAKHRGGPYCR